MSSYSILNIVAILWFFCAWTGYSRFAKYKAKRGLTLSSVLSHERFIWMGQIFERDNRIADVSIVANLERNTSFLASTSILVLASLLTTLGLVGNIDEMLQSLPFYALQENSVLWIHVKILLLVLIFVYAFFTFTWSMRQYGFGSVLIGAAPLQGELDAHDGLEEKYVRTVSKVLDMAAHAYNYGLRSYYFALALLPWFISPWLLIFSTSFVIVVLYSREFHSRPYSVIREYVSFTQTIDRDTAKTD